MCAARDSYLFDPLAFLHANGCTPELVRDREGRSCLLRLHHNRRGLPAPERVARATMVAERFKHLILLQLDMEKGQHPRSVRWLLAHGVIELRKGRYSKTEVRRSRESATICKGKNRLHPHGTD